MTTTTKPNYDAMTDGSVAVFDELDEVLPYLARIATRVAGGAEVSAEHIDQLLSVTGVLCATGSLDGTVLRLAFEDGIDRQVCDLDARLMERGAV